MTVEHALEWVVWTTKQDASELRQIFNDDQLLKLGHWLCNNRLLNPPSKRHVKTLNLMCQCGCGERFTIEYAGGRKPAYKNEAHRARAYRARRKERES